MFSKNEFKKLVNLVPENFDVTAHEFWQYVNERILAIANRVQCVYTDASSLSPKDVSEYEKDIISALIGHGANLEHVGNSMLIAEANAWLKMMEKTFKSVSNEMYLACLREIRNQVINVINHSLHDGELGVLIIDSQFQISFPDSIRIIRMLPFNPQDYLKRYRVIQRLEN
jgi:hypothetical protein